MAASKKLYSDYTEVTTNQLTDQIPVLQSGNKKTTLQKVYNLFVSTLGGLFQSKQAVTVVNIDAQAVDPITSANCILSITNFPTGTGNRTISIDCGEVLSDNDFLQLTLKYDGHAVNLRSYYISGGQLDIFLNVHSNPTEPVIISMNKIN